MQITERDKEILLWINRHGFVTANQVARMFGMHLQKAYLRLKCLVDYGMLKRERILYRKPGLYFLTPAGAQFSESEIAPMRRYPADSVVNHHLQTVDISIEITNHHDAVGWITAREIKNQQAMAALEKTGSSKNILDAMRMRVPDGIVRRLDGHYAIEVELTLKHRPRITKIITDYAMKTIKGELKGVIYFTDKSAVIKALREEIGRTAVEEYFQIYELKGEDKDGRPIFRHAAGAERTGTAIF